MEATSFLNTSLKTFRELVKKWSWWRLLKTFEGLYRSIFFSRKIKVRHFKKYTSNITRSWNNLQPRFFNSSVCARSPSPVCAHKNVTRYLTTSVENRSYSKAVTCKWSRESHNRRFTLSRFILGWLWFFPNIWHKRCKLGRVFWFFSRQIFNFPSNFWALFDETAKEFTSIA